MKYKILWCAAIASLLCVVSRPSLSQSELGYEPSADPFQLVRDARQIAAENGQLVLVMAGGDWCIWCHYLNKFLTENPTIEHDLKETFAVVKAHLGDENFNEEFFATLPEAAGYPHFWVLSPEGEVLVSQNTFPLEDGDKSYDKGKFAEFISTWKDYRP
jgi:thioredoxin-related protein